MTPPDPRSARAAMQDAQAAHRPFPDHDAVIRNGLARSRNPEGVARLLARAADLLRPATEVSND